MRPAQLIHAPDRRPGAKGRLERRSGQRAAKHGHEYPGRSGLPLNQDGGDMMRNRRTLLIGTTLALLTLVVTAATVQKITGSITDPLGAPVQGIQVDFLDASTAELIAIASSHGTGAYVSGSIPIGSYRLLFLDPSGTFQPQFLGAGLEKEGNGSDSFCLGTVLGVGASTTTIVDAELGPLEP